MTDCVAIVKFSFPKLLKSYTNKCSVPARYVSAPTINQNYFIVYS